MIWRKKLLGLADSWAAGLTGLETGGEAGVELMAAF
jgi:hypothetical protein